MGSRLHGRWVRPGESASWSNANDEVEFELRRLFCSSLGVRGRCSGEEEGVSWWNEESPERLKIHGIGTEKRRSQPRCHFGGNHVLPA